ncbi:MAG: hypothetical protein IJ133_07060 [Clostridia bacterium]|nr:hypothetical protein [Clostridia bacterium]
MNRWIRAGLSMALIFSLMLSMSVLASAAFAPDPVAKAETERLYLETGHKFIQGVYQDRKTGKSLPFNLFIPKESGTKACPLMLYMGDGSTVGKEVTYPLKESIGGTIWATAAEQKKHPCYVLVPEYPETVLDDNHGRMMTDWIDVTKRMLDSISCQYNVDRTRLYSTGQSMGCMISMVLAATYPDLLAAELFIDGQWYIDELSGLTSQRFFYVVAENDAKASQGQREVKQMLTNRNVPYSSRTGVNAKAGPKERNHTIAEMVLECNRINFVTFAKGSVLPATVSAGTDEHMYSFYHGYNQEVIRDWIFLQHR